MKRTDKQPKRLSYAQGWVLTNWGMVRHFGRTRAECVAKAVSTTGKPWSECRAYFAVRKARIVLGWRKRK